MAPIGAMCAVHGIDALEGDDLRCVKRVSLQAVLEIGEVVVAEDLLRPPPWRMPAIMEAWFFSSEKMTAAGEELQQRRQRRVVGDVARR